MNVKPKFMKKLWYFEFLAINRSGGAAVKDKVAVEGVLIAYVNQGEEKINVAKHVGRTCEYVPGQSLAVGEGKNTKIQPNAECLNEK